MHLNCPIATLQLSQIFKEVDKLAECCGCLFPEPRKALLKLTTSLSLPFQKHPNNPPKWLITVSGTNSSPRAANTISIFLTSDRSCKYSQLFSFLHPANDSTLAATSNRSTTRRRPISMTRARMAGEEGECRHPRTTINSTATTIRMCTRVRCLHPHHCPWIRRASPLGPVVAVPILTTSHRSWKVSYLLFAIDTGHH